MRLFLVMDRSTFSKLLELNLQGCRELNLMTRNVRVTVYLRFLAAASLGSRIDSSLVTNEAGCAPAAACFRRCATHALSVPQMRSHHVNWEAKQPMFIEWWKSCDAGVA